LIDPDDFGTSLVKINEIKALFFEVINLKGAQAKTDGKIEPVVERRTN
jgi:hypothetical protein